MPGPDHCTSTEQNCSEVIDLLDSGQPDLKDSPITNVDDSWFPDGKSFMGEGIKKAGYAIVLTHDWQLPKP